MCACEHKVHKKGDEKKWLEVAVVADASVVDFHGRDTVHRYVLTLLNIVSAIYGDPTLGANLQFVIRRMVFFEGRMPNGEDPIKEGNSKQSLANVNKWNKRLVNSLEEGQRHDVGVWLTRRDIGGPSGYAPVAGVCDPVRSCSLIHEEVSVYFNLFVSLN